MDSRYQRSRSPLPHPRLHRDLLRTRPSRMRHPLHPFLSDTLCWVEVTSSTVTGSARSSIANCCSRIRFRPRAAASMVVSAWTFTECWMSRTSRNVTRHSREPWRTGHHGRRTNGEHATISKWSFCTPIAWTKNNWRISATNSPTCRARRSLGPTRPIEWLAACGRTESRAMRRCSISGRRGKSAAAGRSGAGQHDALD